jgi:hypothetical protein
MTRSARFVFLLAATVTGLLMPGGAAPTDTRVVSVSLPALQIGAEERVVGFHFQVTSGRIAQIADVPIGWNISVDNDPSWNTKIDASIIVAAAAVDASFFNDFAVLEKDGSSETPFEIKGEVIVSGDFSKFRRIQVKMKDFTIKQRTAGGQQKP